MRIVMKMTMIKDDDNGRMVLIMMFHHYRALKLA